MVSAENFSANSTVYDLTEYSPQPRTAALHKAYGSVESAWPSLKVRNQVAFRLALNAGIRVWEGPGAGDAVVLKLSVLYRSVVTLTGIVQQNPVASIFGHCKTHSVTPPFGGNL